MAADTSPAKGPRKFICPHCNASFRRSGHLSRHKRSHTNEKPFRCPHCESAFGRFDILLRHERTIHGTTDSSKMYSKSAKSDAYKNPKPSLSQPTLFRASQTTSSSATVNTTQGLPTPSFDQFGFSNGISSASTSHISHASFTRSPGDGDSTLLDPQLLSLQPSPHHMLPTPFTTNDLNQLAIDQSPESLPGPSPFNWNDFTFFDELNHSLGILNPTDDMQTQLDQLMSSVVPSGAATGVPSSPAPDFPGVSDSSAPLFRIPASTEVPVKGVHAAPPPTRNIQKKLDEVGWKRLAEQVEAAQNTLELDDFRLPRSNAINRYVGAYISGLNQHIPFLHLPSLNLNEIEISKLLAMCSLGALYCFEKENATKLHTAGMMFLKQALEGKHASDLRDSTWVCQTMLLGMLFASYNGDVNLFRKSLTLHCILANTLRRRLRFLSSYTPDFSDSDIPWSAWVYREEFRRTYFVSFCFLIQLQMLLDIPTSMPISEVNLPLPASEEEWSAESAEEWETIQNSQTCPPTPLFRVAFESLFAGSVDCVHRYSEFGGYVMISALQSAVLNGYRLGVTPAMSIDWRKFDASLDNWQRSWNADPKSHSTGPSSPFGAMAFNASAIYRATSIRRVRDYSKVKATVQFFDERIGTEEMMKMLNDKSFHRVPEMIRALVPACVSLQIPVKMGMKLVAQTAALFWSVEHVFCNFEVALFLSQWLRSIERDGMEGLTNQEAKIVSLLRDLLFEADPDADSRQPMSALLLTVWADQFDGVNVWGITPSLGKIFRGVAETIKTESATERHDDVEMEDFRPVNGISAL